MRIASWLTALSAGVLLSSCSGGGGGTSGSFALIEFLESGQDNIPRNRQVRFRFSSPIDPAQDLFTRLKIQNVIQTSPSNFARAAGSYLVNADVVVFTPRLPNKMDRSDAGFKEDGRYHVFLSGGPDGLTSTSGETVPTQQEYLFDTNTYFEDIKPTDPPRAFQLLAIDPNDGSDTDISRLDPRPLVQAQLDNAYLISHGNIIDPGAGGPPYYATPWHIELRLSEPLDPATVTDEMVSLYEIRENAISDAPATADPGHFGDRVNYRVAINVSTSQSIDEAGNYDIRIRVIPVQTLVDNSRYRMVFSGDILGLDFRKTFSGDNGLTGDGTVIVGGSVYDEAGGLGYVTEFLVADRPGISATRTVEYDPARDGIEPETGQTTLDPDNESNSALYNPPASPGTAVGFLSAFGQGTDGDLAVSGGATVILDTGDTPNAPLGEPFFVTDLNPDDDYLNDTRPGGLLEYDSVEPYELQLSSLIISSSSTLRVSGVNPMMFRVTGLVQINGFLDISGAAGKAGSSGDATGGAAGAGGFPGATSKRGAFGNCRPTGSPCSTFKAFLNTCTQVKTVFPTATNGEGPGRGLAGGELYAYPYDQKNIIGSSGGGGASHGRAGTRGEDRANATQPAGTGGVCDTQYPYNRVSLSSVIGVRSMPGPIYGDRIMETNNMGGSGGGAGGAHHQYLYAQSVSSGGAGGGGGGSLTIVCAGDILLFGRVDASGGAGGKGRLYNAYPSGGSTNWHRVPGGGGGGAGGSIGLISGANINMTGSAISAAGGIGGARGNAGTSTNSTKAGAGGDGGDGFIFLMDADGEIDGFLPGGTGDYTEYDNDARGVLTISPFNADRFSSITAVTELFPMTAANPLYEQYDPLTDINGVTNADQRIHVLVSSARGSDENPLRPDLTTEQFPFEIAELVFQGGATKVTVTGDMADLNSTPGDPAREAFVRVQAAFEYDHSVEAALGPFASIDSVTVSYMFND